MKCEGSTKPCASPLRSRHATRQSLVRNLNLSRTPTAAHRVRMAEAAEPPLPVRSSDAYAVDDDEPDEDTAGLLNNDDDKTPRRARSDSIAFDFSTRIIHLTESAESKGPQRVRDEPIGFVAGVALIVGMCIGSGIFSSPGVVAKETGSVGGALLLWTGAGFLSWAGKRACVWTRKGA